MRAEPRARTSSPTFAWSLVGLVAVSGCDGSTDPQESYRFEAISDTNVTATVGKTINAAPTVRVVNASGQPVPDVEVSFVPADGGTVDNRTDRTNNDGVATAGAWRLGFAAKKYWIHVRARGIKEVLFTAIAAPGPPVAMLPYSGDRQTANIGQALPQALRVVVTDGYNNRVTHLPVTFEVISGGGTISQSTAETDVIGIARSGAWTLGPTAGEQQARARIGSLETLFKAAACDPICQSFQLLFVRDGKLYRMNPGGGVTPIASSGFENDLAVSPDGRRIAFTRWENDEISNLYVMDIDGSNVKRRLTGALSPSWSPDGKQLAVTSSVCYCDIFVLNADDNSAPIAVGFMARQPAWSPDGGRIAFVSLSGLYENHALHVMNADGTGVTVVSARDAGYIDHPTWSPDGTQIAFSKCIDVKCDIHVALADGSSIRKLTTTGNVRGPAWSPDGSWLAVSLSHEVFPSIAYIDAQNGGNPIVIQSSGWSPVWLPTTVTLTRRH